MFAIAVNLLIHPTFANLDGDPAGPDSTVPPMKLLHDESGINDIVIACMHPYVLASGTATNTGVAAIACSAMHAIMALTQAWISTVNKLIFSRS